MTVQVYFEYKKTEDAEWQSTPEQAVTETTSFDAVVDTLDPGAEYEFRAGVYFAGETIYTDDFEQGTLDDVEATEAGLRLEVQF